MKKNLVYSVLLGFALSLSGCGGSSDAATGVASTAANDNGPTPREANIKPSDPAVVTETNPTVSYTGSDVGP
jgi:hypothetical protein